MTKAEPSAPQWIKDWVLRLFILAVITLVVWSYQDAEQTEAGKRLVLAVLRDPDSAVFTGVQSFRPPHNGGKVIVCGYVNSHNGFGGMTGSQRFIVDGVALIDGEGGIVLSDLWAQKCTNE